MRGISVGFLISRLIASGMLILALSGHPYSYYILNYAGWFAAQLPMVRLNQ